MYMRCPCPCGSGLDFFLFLKEKNILNKVCRRYILHMLYARNEVLEFILDLNRKRLRFFDLYANLKIMEKVNQWHCKV